MMLRVALIALALAVAGCNQQSASTDAASSGPQLDAPAPESEPSRVFTAANDAARAVSNELSVSVTQEMPDAADADIQERLTLTGGNGLNVNALVTGAISPATQVGGQTLRALLGLAVEEPPAQRRRHRRRDGGQHLPLRHLCPHSPRHQARRGKGVIP